MTYEKAVERFWSRASKPRRGCWEWQGPRNGSGYGIVNFRDQMWRTHRLSLTLASGPIEDGLQVCHRCDNPPCIRPDHLYVGSALENSMDRADRGRQGVGQFAKLSEADADIIRERALSGEDEAALASDFGVSQNTVRRIARGRIWKRTAGRVVYGPVEQVEGFALSGPRTWVSDGIFVQRWAARSTTWLRFVKEIDGPGHWISAHRSRRKATDGA